MDTQSGRPKSRGALLSRDMPSADHSLTLAIESRSDALAFAEKQVAKKYPKFANHIEMAKAINGIKAAEAAFGLAKQSFLELPMTTASEIGDAIDDHSAMVAPLQQLKSALEAGEAIVAKRQRIE